MDAEGARRAAARRPPSMGLTRPERNAVARQTHEVRPEGARSEATSQIRCTTPKGRLAKRKCGIEERCQSGRMGLTRNQVYGSPVPWVRIPPSPPEKQKRALVALFCFSRRAWLRTSDPVRQAQRRSRMPGREATIPPSPPNRKGPLDGTRLQCPPSTEPTHSSRTDNFMSWAIVDIGRFLESLTGS